MNIEGLPENDDDLRELCQQVLELLNDADRIWAAMPQAPQNHGDWPQDPDWTPPESST